MKMSKKEKTVLTKTQKRSLFRWFLNGGASLNYERMMSMACLLYTSPSPRDPKTSRMPSSA